jgi:hypothetical protein
MVSPRRAFLDIYHDTTKIQGVLVTIIFTTLFVLLIAFTNSEFGFIGSGMGSFGFDEDFLISSAISASIMIPFFVIGLFLVGHFSSDFAGKSGGYKNIDKTIGLLGYGAIVRFVVGTILLVVFPRLIGPGSGYYDDYGNYYLGMEIETVFIIIAIFWSFWVNGSAVSVANDTGIFKGIMSYFIALVFTIILLIIIMAFITIFTIGMFMGGF